MRARWSTHGGPVSAQRTAVDSGPCADGRTGCVGIDVRVTPVTTRFGSRLIEAGHSAGRRNVMSATVPVALVRSSMAWLSAFISGNPRPLLTGLAAGVFHEP